jgi:hypothetical protein
MLGGGPRLGRATTSDDEHDGAGLIVANDMEGVLANVDADDGDSGMICAPGHGRRAPTNAVPVRRDPLVGREHAPSR